MHGYLQERRCFSHSLLWPFSEVHSLCFTRLLHTIFRGTNLFCSNRFTHLIFLRVTSVHQHSHKLVLITSLAVHPTTSPRVLTQPCAPSERLSLITELGVQSEGRQKALLEAEEGVAGMRSVKAASSLVFSLVIAPLMVLGCCVIARRDSASNV